MLGETVRSTGGYITQYLRNILGTYTPLQDQSTGEYIQTAAGVDWEYIISAAIFIMFTWFVLKMLIIIIKR